MKNTIKSMIAMGILMHSVSSNAAGITLDERAVSVPSRLGPVEVSYEEGQFNVTKEGIKSSIQPYWMDSTLRQIDSEDVLTQFLASGGYLSLDQFTEGEYRLKAQSRGPGGGPLLGVLAGIGTAATVIACGVTGNIPGAVAATYAAPAIIAAATVAPTP